MVGVDKHWIEKDLIKFVRKSFKRKPVIPAAGEETKTIDDRDVFDYDDDGLIPLKGVAKKRGKSFAFLQFTDLSEKNDFMEMFASTIAPVKRLRLREVDKIDAKKGFKPVQASSVIAADA